MIEKSKCLVLATHVFAESNVIMNENEKINALNVQLAYIISNSYLYCVLNSFACSNSFKCCSCVSCI